MTYLCVREETRGKPYFLARVFLRMYTYACVVEKESGVNDLSHEGRSGGSEARSHCSDVGEACPDLPSPVDLISVAIFKKQWWQPQAQKPSLSLSIAFFIAIWLDSWMKSWVSRVTFCPL